MPSATIVAWRQRQGMNHRGKPRGTDVTLSRPPCKTHGIYGCREVGCGYGVGLYMLGVVRLLRWGSAVCPTLTSVQPFNPSQQSPHLLSCGNWISVSPYCCARLPLSYHRHGLKATALVHTNAKCLATGQSQGTHLAYRIKRVKKTAY